MGECPEIGTYSGVKKQEYAQREFGALMKQ